MTGSPRRRPGRMAAHVEPFREWLGAAGYTPGTARGLLAVMGKLGRWMDVNVGERALLTLVDFESFADSLRAQSAHWVPRLHGNDPLRVYLVEVGALALSSRTPRGEVEVLIDAFRGG